MNKAKLSFKYYLTKTLINKASKMLLVDSIFSKQRLNLTDISILKGTYN